MIDVMSFVILPVMYVGKQCNRSEALVRDRRCAIMMNIPDNSIASHSEKEKNVMYKIKTFPQNTIIGALIRVGVG